MFEFIIFCVAIISIWLCYKALICFLNILSGQPAIDVDKTCHRCNMVIPKGGSVCPHCRSDVSTFGDFLAHWFGLAIIGGIIYLITLLF